MLTDGWCNGDHLKIKTDWVCLLSRDPHLVLLAAFLVCTRCPKISSQFWKLSQFWVIRNKDLNVKQRKQLDHLTPRDDSPGAGLKKSPLRPSKGLALEGQASLALTTWWHSENRSLPNTFQTSDHCCFEQINKPAKWQIFFSVILFIQAYACRPLVAFQFPFHALFLKNLPPRRPWDWSWPFQNSQK